MKKVILSVFNKSGIVEFVKVLINLDYELYFMGGIKCVLEDVNINIKFVLELI